MGLCGPSEGEKQAANAEASFAQTMTQTFKSQLSAQTATLAQINGNLQSLASGNTPMGFSPQTLSMLQGSAVTNAGQLFRNAMQRQATTFSGAGGGGGSALPSGVQQQVYGDIAAQGAAAEAKNLLDVNLADVQLGRENLIAATTGLDKMAELQSPESYAGEAGSSLSQSFQQQHAMSEESTQALSAIGGLVTAGVGAATGLGGLVGGAAPGVVGAGNAASGPMAQPYASGVNYPSAGPAPDIGVGAGLAAFNIPDIAAQP